MDFPCFEGALAGAAGVRIGCILQRYPSMRGIGYRPSVMGLAAPPECGGRADSLQGTPDRDVAEGIHRLLRGRVVRRVTGPDDGHQ